MRELKELSSVAVYFSKAPGLETIVSTNDHNVKEQQMRTRLVKRNEANLLREINAYYTADGFSKEWSSYVLSHL